MTETFSKMHLHVQIWRTKSHWVFALKVESATTQQVSYLSITKIGVYCVLRFME